ncbi:hypothetical protein [Reichenbachiella sp.]|uniref:hypothetical protein n=1 Tax=Reichenbachiella sp. TaxID=2184521 RepID=UPI00329961BD
MRQRGYTYGGNNVGRSAIAGSGNHWTDFAWEGIGGVQGFQRNSTVMSRNNFASFYGKSVEEKKFDVAKSESRGMSESELTDAVGELGWEIMEGGRMIYYNSEEGVWKVDIDFVKRMSQTNGGTMQAGMFPDGVLEKVRNFFMGDGSDSPKARKTASEIAVEAKRARLKVFLQDSRLVIMIKQDPRSIMNQPDYPMLDFIKYKTMGGISDFSDIFNVGYVPFGYYYHTQWLSEKQPELYYELWNKSRKF